MAEATIASNDSAMQDAAREIDRARVKQLGSFHFVLVMGALTLWGAAETWAQTTGWTIAHVASVANALIAGFVIPSTIHEWGHFAGARLSRSVSPVLEEPKRHFFMFDFPMDQNDVRQFMWMSWGGILAPWGLVVLTPIFVPLGMTSGAVLFATIVSRAVAASAFEVPVVLRTGRSGNPGAQLAKQATGGGLPRSRRVGAAVGAACFALVWIVA